MAPISLARGLCATVFVTALSAHAQEAATALDEVYANPSTLHQENRTALTAWLDKNRQDLDRPGALSALAKRLGTARVVGVGEATHGTHEDMALKAELVALLVRDHGFGVVALEANRSVGERLQRFIERGSRETDPGLALHESRIFEVYRVEAMGQLLRALQTHNRDSATPVRIVGIDVQDPVRDGRAALERLRQIDPARAERLNSALAALVQGKPVSMPGPFVQATRAQWEAWMTAATELEVALPQATEPLAHEAAYALRMALHTFEFNVGAGDSMDLPTEAYTRRDVAMAERTLRVAGANDRVALWAHDGHVADNGYLLAGPAAPTTGLALRQHLGTRYQSVNFSYGEATFHARRATADGAMDRSGAVPVWSRHMPADSLDAAVTAAPGQRFWVDLAALPRDARFAAWFRATPFRRGSYGAVVLPPEQERAYEMPDVLGYGVDVLIRLPRLTPSRFYPKPAPAKAP